MSSTIPVGPYKQVQTSDPGQTAPWYIMPFDKSGTCTAPLTRNDLINSIKEGGYTDLYLFSHGWNNDWETASDRYEDFISGFLRMRAQYQLQLKPGYKPLLVGVFWPSTALVAPWERAPRFAGAAPGSAGSAIDDFRREVEELAADMDAGDRGDFYALAQLQNLNQPQAERLAEIVARVASKFQRADKEVGPQDDPVSSKELIERARRMRSPGQPRSRPGQFGFAGGAASPGPQAAFTLSDLDPRKLVRLATVLQMKDRAATVGAIGVGPLLSDILRAGPGLRAHLVGHSYGAIVVLSAVCNPDSLAAKVHSILLLQPAVSQWCFAEDVAGRGYAGGYRVALERVTTPIFTTYSKNDAPLTTFFHLAARRDKDLGQPEIAGLPPAPSAYAALGGFGPAGLKKGELQILELTAPPVPLAPLPLTLNPPPRVCALNGNELIDGHGDISVPATWWSLFQQVSMP